jgi:transposase
LRGFGLKLGEVSRGRFAARVRELVAGQPTLERVVEPMLRAREALRAEHQVLHRAVLAIVREDATCRRLMGVPGVGALVAITFTSAVDDPARFRRSRAVGAHFGLTPKKYQSGETDVTGGISKVGDVMVRTALYEAANVMLTRAGRFSTLKRWALGAGRWVWRGVGACGGRRWRWRASWRPCCTAFGSTGASSASANRRLRRDRLTGEEGEGSSERGRTVPLP